MRPSLPNSKKSPAGVPPQHWHWWVWYLIFTLGMLWLWQEAAHQVVYRTIDYSQFKKYLAQGEVVECAVGQSEITDLPGFREKDVEVRVEPCRLVISGQREEVYDRTKRRTTYSERRSKRFSARSISPGR
jgi:FtsH Extracellular/Hsp20/alpha crystallin family